MNEAKRKLIEQLISEKRPRDQMYGLGSFREAVKNIELNTRGLSSSVAAAMKQVEAFKEFNRPWETQAERLRELSALNNSEYHRISKILGSSNSSLDAGTQRDLILATSTLRDRYRLPAMTELPDLLRAVDKAFAPLSPLHLNMEEIQKTLRAIRTPWLDTLNTTRSFGGLANLAALGAAVRAAPYSPTTIRTVKDALGGWTSIPTEIDANSIGREEFYEQHGLDNSILAIPEPAFTETLETTGIVNFKLLVPDADNIEFETEELELAPEELALFGRMARAARILQLFEVKLREFIHQAMTAQCGNGWESGRLPGNNQTYQKWQGKQQKAIKNGELALELIYYADFTDYSNVITRSDNWEQIFSKVFLDKDDLRVSFRRLESLRLLPMHSRPVTKGDLLTIGTETTRILTAIGVLQVP